MDLLMFIMEVLYSGEQLIVLSNLYLNVKHYSGTQHQRLTFNQENGACNIHRCDRSLRTQRVMRKQPSILAGVIPISALLKCQRCPRSHCLWWCMWQLSRDNKKIMDTCVMQLQKAFGNDDMVHINGACCAFTTRSWWLCDHRKEQHDKLSSWGTCWGSIIKSTDWLMYECKLMCKLLSLGSEDVTVSSVHAL